MKTKLLILAVIISLSVKAQEKPCLTQTITTPTSVTNISVYGACIQGYIFPSNIVTGINVPNVTSVINVATSINSDTVKTIIKKQ
jgi:hypothetical protein